MRVISFSEAIKEALKEEMSRSQKMLVLGEDVSFGGTFGLESGLAEKWPERVLDTPISESGFMGTAVGAAIAGFRPYIQMSYNDFLPVAMDQIVNQAAKMRFLTGGQVKVPIVISTGVGRGRSAGAQHSQTLISWFMHIPGLKVVTPSTPYDAKGLLKTALRDDNPVMYYNHILLLRDVKGFVPKEEYTIPFGKADVKREGKDVTIVAILLMVHKAIAAAEALAEEGISAEVLDPRTIVPFDKETLLDSVKKTGRLVIAEEECKRGGVGAEIAAMVAEEAIDYLDAPIKRVATLNTPIPHSPPQEKYVIPDEKALINSVRQVVGTPV